MSETQTKDAEIEARTVTRNGQISASHCAKWFSLATVDIDNPENLLFIAISNDDGSLVSRAIQDGARPNHVFRPKHPRGDALPVYAGVFADEPAIRRIEDAGLSAVGLAIASNSPWALSVLLDSGGTLDDWYALPTHVNMDKGSISTAYLPVEVVRVLKSKKTGWMADPNMIGGCIFQKGHERLPPKPAATSQSSATQAGCLSVLLLALGLPSALILIRLLA